MIDNHANYRKAFHRAINGEVFGAGRLRFV
jgi:hypothetical protein